MPSDDALVAAARAARSNACARWSRFHVGAALLTSDGRIYTGVNVECSSYGGTICAERTALVKALSEGERDFVAIAVATSSAEPVMPCGLCRQLLFDYAREIRVIAVGERDVVRATLRELLPFGFEGPR